jgi:hypothetical protein
MSSSFVDVKVRAAVSAGASLIVNACDGEFGAVKDEFVVEQHLDELVRGANLLGRNGIRYAVGCDGQSEFRLRSAGLDVLSVPHRYVSSEESALVSLANGGLARPITKRVPVVYGSTSPSGQVLPPTVVLNAETGGGPRRSPTPAPGGSARSEQPTNPARGSRRSPARCRRRGWSRRRPAWPSGTWWRRPAERIGRSAVSGSVVSAVGG